MDESNSWLRILASYGWDIPRNRGFNCYLIYLTGNYFLPRQDSGSVSPYSPRWPKPPHPFLSRSPKVAFNQSSCPLPLSSFKGSFRNTNQAMNATALVKNFQSFPVAFSVKPTCRHCPQHLVLHDLRAFISPPCFPWSLHGYLAFSMVPWTGKAHPLCQGQSALLHDGFLFFIHNSIQMLPVQGSIHDSNHVVSLYDTTFFFSF